jgi:hypothetical protein
VPEELIVTAAHCIEGVTDGIPYTSTDLAFSPMWHNNQVPFGTWTVHKVFLNSWMTCTIPLVDCHTNPANDYAVIVLNPHNGKGVGDVTGANGWSVNQPATLSNVTLAGILGRGEPSGQLRGLKSPPRDHRRPSRDGNNATGRAVLPDLYR